MRWYVVQTKPACEAQAARELTNQGFESCSPSFLQRRTKHGRTIYLPRPLFPGYGFVGFDIARDAWRSVNGTRGVVRLLVANEDCPLPVPFGVVEMLQARAAPDGYVHFEREETPWLALADKPVRVTVGPWAGFHGLVKKADNERIGVLMSLFGREVPVTMDWTDVEPV